MWIRCGFLLIICIPFRSQRIPLKASNISDKLNKEKNRRRKKEKSKWPFYWLYVNLLYEKLQIFPTHQNVHFSLHHLNRHIKLNVLEDKRMKKKRWKKFRRRHYKKRHIMNKCTQAVATYSASKRKSRCELYEFILSVLAVSNQGKLRERSSLFTPFRCINHHNSLSHATKNEKCYNISLRWLHHICILKKLKNDRRRKNQNEKCNK